MTGFLLTALGAALVGSVHCGAMCGPLATLYREPGRAGACAGDHAAFAGARLAAYVVLGALAGLVGHTVNVGAEAIVAWQAAAAMVTGGLLVVGGAATLLSRVGVAVPFMGQPAVAPKLLRLVRGKPRRRAALVGALTASLPCGWLLAFVLAAAGTGSPWWGAATLAMLWLGSAPILALVSVGLGQIAKRMGAKAQFVTPVLLIVAGIGVLTLRSNVPTVAASTASSSASTAGAAGEAAGSNPSLGEPSCHEH